MNGFELLLIGLFLGFLAVVPPGPISLTLVEIGSAHGRRSGVRAGLGVATAEAAIAIVAVLIVAGLGEVLAPRALSAVQLLSTMMLFAVGLALLLRPKLCQALAIGITRPGLTMFIITVATPTVLGSWIALLAALPVDDGFRQLGFIGAGGSIASLAWHLALGAGAGTVGQRLSGPHRVVMTRAGGSTMVALGLVSLAAIIG